MNRHLTTYFDGMFISGSRIYRILFLLLPLKIRLKKFSKTIRIHSDVKFKNFSYIKKLRINPEEEKSVLNKGMTDYLIENLYNDLKGAYIHGSLGTGDEIAYSDFDALVILKDEVFESSKRVANVARKLIKAKKIMYEFDPLQHHGWFIMTESDLKNYPQTYFPHELFEYAKSLFPEKGTELEIHLNKEGYDYKKPFTHLADSVVKKIESGKIPKNMYQLKGLLSQFMLLPALYVQARDKKGVYKKYSFDRARKDFSEEEWKIMDEVSEIRKKWHYKISFLQKQLLLIVNPMLRRIISMHFSPKIPMDIKLGLTNQFYRKIVNLCELMKRKIEMDN